MTEKPYVTTLYMGDYYEVNELIKLFDLIKWGLEDKETEGVLSISILGDQVRIIVQNSHLSREGWIASRKGFLRSLVSLNLIRDWKYVAPSPNAT